MTDGPVEEAINELTVGDGRIKVILTAPVFFPDLKGGYNRVIRLSTPLAELDVDLFLFTALRSHHESNQIDVEKIKVFRFPEPEDLASNDLRARLYERAHQIAQRCPAGHPHRARTTAARLAPVERAVRSLVLSPSGRLRLWQQSGDTPTGLIALWKLRILTCLLFFPLKKISVLSTEMKRLFRQGRSARSKNLGDPERRRYRTISPA